MPTGADHLVLQEWVSDDGTTEVALSVCEVSGERIHNNMHLLLGKGRSELTITSKSHHIIGSHKCYKEWIMQRQHREREGRRSVEVRGRLQHG